MIENAVFFGWAVFLSYLIAFRENLPPIIKNNRIGFSLFVVMFFILLQRFLVVSWSDLPNFLIVDFLPQIIMASALAAVLVPWMRSAFSGPQAEKSDKLFEANENRFRYLTFMIAIVATAKIALPYIEPWLQRTSNVEVGVFKLSLYEPPHRSRNVETASGAVLGTGDDTTRAVGALENIVSVTYRSGPNRRFTGNEELSVAVSDQKLAINDRPMMARDLLYSKYLNSNGKFDAFNSDRKFGLDMHMNELFHANHEFMVNLSNPLRCALAAAKVTRDYRLVMLDIHPVLRWLMRLTIIEDAEITSGAKYIQNNRFTTPSKLSNLREPDSDITGWQKLVDDAKKILVGYLPNGDEGDRELRLHCPDIKDAIPSLRRLWELSGDLGIGRRQEISDKRVQAVRNAPYAAMSTAWMFSGIGGVESATSVLARWLYQHRNLPSDDAENATMSWLQARATMELSWLVPDEIIDAGNAVLNEFHDKMYADLRSHLPGGTDWYLRDACSITPNRQDSSRLFREVEQNLQYSLMSFRLRVYRAKIALNKSYNRVVGDDIIQEAKILADIKPNCFLLVPNYQGTENLVRGQALAYVGHLQKSYVDVRLGTRVTQEQRERLKEARSYFRRAQTLLERYDEEKKAASRETSPTYTLSDSKIDRLGLAAVERRLLEGEGPAGHDLARMRRATAAIDQLLGEE